MNGSSEREGIHGEHIGTVVSTADPLHLMRVQVRVHLLFDGVPDGDLPWATYRLPIGAGVNKGGFLPVEVGDTVWVDFPFGGDTRRPRITGSVHEMPDSLPNMPHDAWNGPSPVQHKRTGNEPLPEAPGYHRDVVASYHGVVIEITKAGALRATQKDTGTAIEIATDGTITLHSENHILGSAPHNLELGIGENAEITVGNNAEIAVGDSAKLTVGKTMLLQVPALTVKTSTIQLEGNVSSSGAGGGKGTVTENADRTQTGNLVINGDLTVNGNATVSGDHSTSGNSYAGSRSGGAI